jgi:hypothetical protein
MNKLELPYVIKPVLHKNFFVRLTIFLLFIIVMVISVSYENGKFDIGMLVYQSVMMSLMLYVVIRFSYRTIEVNDDQYIYKGLMRKIKVKYLNVEKLFVIEKKVSKDTSYSLIVSERTNWQISSIQGYRKNEIEMLIRKIGLISKIASSEIEEVIGDLEKVKWLHD